MQIVYDKDEQADKVVSKQGISRLSALFDNSFGMILHKRVGMCRRDMA